MKIGVVKDGLTKAWHSTRHASDGEDIRVGVDVCQRTRSNLRNKIAIVATTTLLHGEDKQKRRKGLRGNVCGTNETGRI